MNREIDPWHISELHAKMKDGGIPSYMRAGLEDWIFSHRPGGGFLQNLLANNLFESFSKADNLNKRHLEDYISFLYNHAPAACWGSPEKVAEWCDEKYHNMLEPYNVRNALKNSHQISGV